MPWLTPEGFDQAEREEQAALVVYAVERRREDIEDLADAVEFGVTKALARAFAKREEQDDG